MDPILVVLRLLHVGAGVLWVGAAWTIHLFITPTLRALGQDAEKNFMSHITRQRRLSQVIFGATLVTVAAGATLYWIDWQRYGATWFQSGFGIGITIGAAGATVAFLLGPTLILPAVNRMNALAAQIDATGGPPSADQLVEMERLGTRLDKVFRVDFVMLVVAVFFMAIARYL